MRLPTMIAAAALLFPAATLAAQDAAPFPAVVLTDETLLAEVAEAEERGRMLWLYDQAAWHATDSFLAEFDQDKLGKFMRGYIVVPREDELLDAIFFGEFGNGLVEVARYSVDESTVIGGGIHPAEARPALAKSASQLASVRQAALESAGEQRLTLCAR